MTDWQTEFPQMTVLPGADACRVGRDLLPGAVVKSGYFGVVDVPHYEDRYVFVFDTGDEITVFADGPPSPHRYSDRTLCMWFPGAVNAQRWTPDDGMLELLYHVRNHLFREAYWHETGRWPGDEHPHGDEAAA